MSKPLFEFVKVAAGDKFPFQSDYFTLNQHGQYHLSGNHYREYGERYPFDEFILRPAESPDAGREGEIKSTPWVDFSVVALTQDHGEVIGFHPEWIYQDFNPNGTRIGFVNGDGEFYNAAWWDYQDTYIHGEPKMPTKYMSIPSPTTLSTPADPGSQVEAVDPVKLLEWINEKYLVFAKGSEQHLLTLYKQSL